MGDRVEFGSRAWVDKLGEIVNELVASAPEASQRDFSICERYTDPPAHLAPPTGLLGWHMRIEDGRVHVFHEPSEDVDVLVTADYATVLPLARTTYGGPDGRAEAQKSLVPAVRDGRLSVVGNLEAGPDFLSALHDRLAEITA